MYQLVPYRGREEPDSTNKEQKTPALSEAEGKNKQPFTNHQSQVTNHESQIKNNERKINPGALDTHSFRRVLDHLVL